VYDCLCVITVTDLSCTIEEPLVTTIPDEQMTASSVFDSTYLPHFARINNHNNEMGWCPSQEELDKGVLFYIQVCLVWVVLLYALS